jgi:sugar O-acyltransferase (sialic acid O-acetyltransferase NeuD family)
MKVIVYGASDHGKYTIDILERQGLHTVIGMIDDRVEPGVELYGYSVLGSGSELNVLSAEYGFGGGVIAVGDNHIRSKIAKRVRTASPKFQFVTAVHPFTSIGRDTTIGAGSVVMAGAIVNGSCVVGQHCFIATKASLDHDSALGDFSSMSPGATTGGNVTVGEYSTLSIGSTVVHGTSIGDHTVIGAGSTVTGDIESHVVAYGTPARTVRLRGEGEPYL